MYISRYAILTKQTFPKWQGEDKAGIIHILKTSNINTDEYQLGKTMVFIKAPESVRFNKNIFMISLFRKKEVYTVWNASKFAILLNNKEILIVPYFFITCIVKFQSCWKWKMKKVFLIPKIAQIHQGMMNFLCLESDFICKFIIIF